ncbi:MAG: glycosyltransferase family 2 protein [Spirochaetaceae bacterium]|jgi:glycosyltransferase involved in cell wall biosynthesis|nr:glycosyltransferase family 2 protein [Spirochaetaceae bacterium]
MSVKISSTPKISVILLAFNRPQYLTRAFESVLSQTFDNFEIILVDNGSTDGETNTICRKLAENKSNVKLLQRTDSNIGRGRNAALDAAQGEYIVYVDDDDYASPELLDFLYRLALEYDADISFCGSYKQRINNPPEVQFEFNKRFVMTPEEAVYEVLERKITNSALTPKLLKRGLCTQFYFPDGRKYDDITISYKLFASANRIAADGKPLYTFLRHSANNSGFTNDDKQLNPLQLEEYFCVYKERTEWLCKKLPTIAEYINYSEWSFLLSMYRKITVNKLTHCEKQRSYCAAYLEKAGDRYIKSSWIKDFEFTYLDLYKETKNDK